MTRIIGYLKRVSNFSVARQKEAARRYYAGPNKLGQTETVQQQTMMQDKQAS
jgi:ribonucleoside-triphosphate reductase